MTIERRKPFALLVLLLRLISAQQTIYIQYSGEMISRDQLMQKKPPTYKVPPRSSKSRYRRDSLERKSSTLSQSYDWGKGKGYSTKASKKSRSKGKGKGYSEDGKGKGYSEDGKGKGYSVDGKGKGYSDKGKGAPSWPIERPEECWEYYYRYEYVIYDDWRGKGAKSSKGKGKGHDDYSLDNDDHGKGKGHDDYSLDYNDHGKGKGQDEHSLDYEDLGKGKGYDDHSSDYYDQGKGKGNDDHSSYDEYYRNGITRNKGKGDTSSKGSSDSSGKGKGKGKGGSDSSSKGKGKGKGSKSTKSSKKASKSRGRGTKKRIKVKAKRRCKPTPMPVPGGSTPPPDASIAPSLSFFPTISSSPTTSRPTSSPTAASRTPSPTPLLSTITSPVPTNSTASPEAIDSTTSPLPTAPTTSPMPTGPTISPMPTGPTISPEPSQTDTETNVPTPEDSSASPVFTGPTTSPLPTGPTVSPMPTGPTTSPRPTAQTASPPPTGPTQSPGPTDPTISPMPTGPTISPMPTGPTIDPELAGPTVSPMPTGPTISPMPTGPTVDPEPVGPTVSPMPTGPTISPKPTGPTVDPEPTGPTVSPMPTGPTTSPMPTGPTVDPDPTVSPMPTGPTISLIPTGPTTEPEPTGPTVSPMPTGPTTSPMPTGPTIDPEPSDPTVSPSPTGPTVSPNPTSLQVSTAVPSAILPTISPAPSGPTTSPSPTLSPRPDASAAPGEQSSVQPSSEGPTVLTELTPSVNPTISPAPSTSPQPTGTPSSEPTLGPRCITKANTFLCEQRFAEYEQTDEPLPFGCDCYNFCDDQFIGCCDFGERCKIDCTGILVAGCDLGPTTSPRPTRAPTIPAPSPPFTRPPQEPSVSPSDGPTALCAVGANEALCPNVTIGQIPIEGCDCYNYCNGRFNGCCGFGEVVECIQDCVGFVVSGCRLDNLEVEPTQSPRPTTTPAPTITPRPTNQPTISPQPTFSPGPTISPSISSQPSASARPSVGTELAPTAVNLENTTSGPSGDNLNFTFPRGDEMFELSLPIYTLDLRLSKPIERLQSSDMAEFSQITAQYLKNHFLETFSTEIFRITDFTTTFLMHEEKPLQSQIAIKLRSIATFVSAAGTPSEEAVMRELKNAFSGTLGEGYLGLIQALPQTNHLSSVTSVQLTTAEPDESASSQNGNATKVIVSVASVLLFVATAGIYYRTFHAKRPEQSVIIKEEATSSAGTSSEQMSISVLSTSKTCVYDSDATDDQNSRWWEISSKDSLEEDDNPSTETEAVFERLIVTDNCNEPSLGISTMNDAVSHQFVTSEQEGLKNSRHNVRVKLEPTIESKKKHDSTFDSLADTCDSQSSTNPFDDLSAASSICSSTVSPSRAKVRGPLKPEISSLSTGQIAQHEPEETTRLLKSGLAKAPKLHDCQDAATDILENCATVPTSPRPTSTGDSYSEPIQIEELDQWSCMTVQKKNIRSECDGEGIHHRHVDTSARSDHAHLPEDPLLSRLRTQATNQVRNDPYKRPTLDPPLYERVSDRPTRTAITRKATKEPSGYRRQDN